MKIKTEPAHTQMPTVVRGVLASVSEGGEAYVDFVGNPNDQPISALSTISVCDSSVGREAVLMFEDGDPSRPILLGLIENQSREKSTRVQVDKESLLLTAKREIVLRCGDASITLTRAGKILIRGNYVLSSSSGVNMVKGGVIRLN